MKVEKVLAHCFSFQSLKNASPFTPFPSFNKHYQ